MGWVFLLMSHISLIGLLALGYLLDRAGYRLKAVDAQGDIHPEFEFDVELLQHLPLGILVFFWLYLLVQWQLRRQSRLPVSTGGS